MSRDDFLRYAARFPDALLLVSDEGRILAANDAALETVGMREDKLREKSLFEWGSPGREGVLAALRLWASSGRMVHGPASFKFPGTGAMRGEGAVMLPAAADRRATLIVRLRRQAATVEKFLGLNRQIDQLHKVMHARKLAEAEVRNHREWLQVTLSSIGDAVIATDMQGRITFVNPVAEQLTGWSGTEAVGRPMQEIFNIVNEHTRSVVENPIERVLQEGMIVGLANHTILRARDGTERPIEDSAAPIRGADGRLIGVVMVFHDVSEKHAARSAIERARDEAVAASKAKDDFLAALSHELRTPLNPILLLASEAAADESLPLGVRQDFDTIVRNVVLEARLIDDLLDITRITRGKLSIERRPVDVHAVVRDAINTVREDLAAKPVGLELKLDAAQAVVSGDAARLQQVFWNLLKNAVKFTPAHGHIMVRTANDGPDGGLLVQVVDSGIGMTAKETQRAFDAFFQGDHSNHGSSRVGGLGLGLAISRSLVEQHGGVIEATSAGRLQGTTFMVRLPVLRADAAGSGSAGTNAEGGREAAVSGGCRRLLLVEDHEPTRVALERLLGNRNYEVVGCASIATALRHAEEQAFDLVISDIGLPDGQGYDLMKVLRERHGLHGIALTGYGMEHDVAASVHAGFVAHLTKPVTVRTLDAALRDAQAARQNE